MDIKISKINVDEWEKLKELRLEALKLEAFSFGSSYEDSLKSLDTKWKDQLQRSLDENLSVMLFAKDGNDLVGMIGAFWDDREKTKHVGNIFGVYVKSSYRGKGIGGLLMKAILGKLDSMLHIEKIKLSVVIQQIPALKMYEKYGFKIVGKCEKELCVDGVYYDEYIMEKFKEQLV